MNINQKLKLIKEVGEEITKEEELKKILSSDEKLIAYDGFEPSGQIHIAQGILRAININKMIKAGFKFKMLVADWHALANNKMGGNLEHIQTTGKYFIEIWKASGMNLNKVEFIWASDLVKNPKYWLLVLQIGRTNVLRRFIRTAEMMGREASLDKLTGANIIYSCMQVADIFTLGAKVTQLGMDQRKVNMLAREIGPQLNPPAGGWKPIVISHHMLMGLGKPPETTKDKVAKTIAMKMSKSNPDSAIFMTDTQDEIQRKINKAWCPEGEIKNNPILEYCRYIIFESVNKLVIERPTKHGGVIAFNSYVELEKAFASKQVHPMDLKNTVAKEINKLIEPVRYHFKTNERAKQLLNKVKSYQITR